MFVHAAFVLGGEFGSVRGQGGTGRPVLAPLHLSVEMIQKVTQELVSILLLVTPETWHDFPDDIKESVWAEGSLTPLPK